TLALCACRRPRSRARRSRLVTSPPATALAPTSARLLARARPTPRAFPVSVQPGNRSKGIRGLGGPVHRTGPLSSLSNPAATRAGRGKELGQMQREHLGAREVHRHEQGFTLIELMMVVLIIAILVAVLVPVFLGASNRAKDRAMQSSLRNALIAAKT